MGNLCDEIRECGIQGSIVNNTNGIASNANLWKELTSKYNKYKLLKTYKYEDLFRF